MGVCFLCDEKLNGGCTQVCSSITSSSNVPFPEKIAEIMGDEIVVIVTSADHMCKKCTTLLNHMDKLEYDLKLVKNEMFSRIEKKYGLLLPYQAVKGVEIVNKHLKAEKLLEQRKVPSDLRVGVSPTVTTPAVISPVQTPLKLLNRKQQQHQQQQQQPPSQQKSANKIKQYKCTFCGFQSKELGLVRIHLRTHENNKKPEKPILNQAVTNELTTVPQQKEQLYRCQICSKTFNCRVNFHDHIQKDHYRPTPSTSTGERETEYSCLVTTKVMKPEPPKTQENNHQADSMNVDQNQKDNNKGNVDMDMMLNGMLNVPHLADVQQQKDTENFQKYKTEKEAKWKIKPEPAQEETTDEVKEDTKDMMLNGMLNVPHLADVQQQKDTENFQKYKTEKEAKWKIKPEPAQEETTDEVKEDTKDVMLNGMLNVPHFADVKQQNDTKNFQKYKTEKEAKWKIKPESAQEETTDEVKEDTKDMMLNGMLNVPHFADVKQQNDTKNFQKYKTEKEAKWKIKPESAQEETTDEVKEDTKDMMLNGMLNVPHFADVKQQNDTKNFQKYKTEKEAKWKIKPESAQEETTDEVKEDTKDMMLNGMLNVPHFADVKQQNDTKNFQKYKTEKEAKWKIKPESAQEETTDEVKEDTKDMMLNGMLNVPHFADVKQQNDTKNFQKYKTEKEAKWKIKPESAQEETTDEVKEDTTMLKQEEAYQKTPVVVKKEVDEDNANVGNQTGDLDLESM